MRLEVLDQRGAPGPLLAQPLHLVGGGVAARADPVGVSRERLEVAGARVREPPNRDAADPIGALQVLVTPGRLVAGAGRDDVDLVPLDQPLGNQPAVVLRPAEDFGAVPRDDERNLHDRRDGPRGSCSSTRSAGGSVGLRRSRQPGKGRRQRPAGHAGLALQPVQQVQVPLLDDGPGVVAPEVRAPVGAERFRFVRAPREPRQRLDELVRVLVEEARVAPQALPLEHVALRVGQHRRPDGPRLERDDRQALVVRRHHQNVRGRHAVELVLLGHETQVRHARVVGDRQDGVAAQHELERTLPGPGVARVEREQLVAALVLVDPPHVDRERTPDPELLAEPLRLDARRHFRTAARHDRRHPRIAGRRMHEVALLGRQVDQAANARQQRCEQRDPDGRLAFGGRHEHRPVCRRARAVVGLVVPEAPEQEEVERGAVSPGRGRSAPGSRALRRRARPVHRRASGSRETPSSTTGRTARRFAAGGPGTA